MHGVDWARKALIMLLQSDGIHHPVRQHFCEFGFPLCDETQDTTSWVDLHVQ